MGFYTHLSCHAQLCIKNKDTSLVSDQSYWNMDESVADITILGLLINLIIVFIIWRDFGTPNKYMSMGHCTQLYCHEQLCVLKSTIILFEIKLIGIWMNQWLIIDHWCY
jgi:hypothetical protein